MSMNAGAISSSGVTLLNPRHCGKRPGLKRHSSCCLRNSSVLRNSTLPSSPVVSILPLSFSSTQSVTAVPDTVPPLPGSVDVGLLVLLGDFGLFGAFLLFFGTHILGLPGGPDHETKDS